MRTRKPSRGSLPFKAEDLLPARALAAGDEDAFNHEAIVRNLAFHVLNGETPLNIALYGPWGSGKSSAFELLRRNLDRKSAHLVRYVAWRYGGPSLQRSFVSHAATELGFPPGNDDTNRYHGGLYQGTRSAKLRGFKVEDLKKFPVLALALGVPALLILVGMAAAAAFVDGLNVHEQISKAITAFFILPAGIVALILPAVRVWLDGARVQLDRSKPAEAEEFVDRFNDLVVAACKKHSVERLVFFIDELDRCSPDDVVTTLTTIAAFADHEKCVFIVSADRDALEEALQRSLRQATPANVEKPYYSSASSFLDKIFDHQFFLPPLRAMRLTRFARDLLDGRGGAWGEIREHGGQPLLDRVIYVLVPSHVVSPRRVKALLNNFATNARTMQARGIGWLDRTLEIAKLTVLQTEFPRFAEDLHVEPRLPEMLLDSPAQPSERAKRLLERHGVRCDGGDEETEGPESNPRSESDPVVGGTIDGGRDGGDEVRRQIVKSQDRNLRRYLQRTHAVGAVGIGRDLLYLEAAGAAHGLEDPVLSELVESDAIERPEAVIEELSKRGETERIAVVRVLADMLDQEFGVERRNVLTALLGVIQQVQGTGEAVMKRVADSLRFFMEGGELDAGHLPGALRVAAQSGSTELAEEVAEDERLYLEAGATAAALLLGELPGKAAELVHEGVASRLADDPSLLDRPLRDLSGDAAAALLGNATIMETVRQLCSGDHGGAEIPDDWAETLYAAGGANNEPSQPLTRLQWILFDVDDAYPVVREHATQVMDMQKLGETRDSHALKGMSVGAVDDWGFWAAYLSDGADVPERRVGLVAELCSTLLAESGDRVAIDVVQRLAPFAAALKSDAISDIADRFDAALTTNTWWESDEAAEQQAARYAIATALAAENRDLAAAVDEQMCADALHVTEEKDGPGSVAPVVPLKNAVGLSATAVLASAVPIEALKEIGEKVRDEMGGDDPEVETASASTLLTIAGVLQERDEGIAFGDTDALIAAVAGSGTKQANLVAKWIRLQPDWATVLALVRGIGPEQRVAGALGEWAALSTAVERTILLCGILENTPQLSGYVEPVARHGVEDVALLLTAGELIRGAGNHEKRRIYVDFIRALRPSDPKAQKGVADVMIGLLESGHKVDFELALQAADALGTGHRSGDRLRQALDKATKTTGYRIPPGRVDALTHAGIRLKQRSLSDAARERWESLTKTFW